MDVFCKHNKVGTSGSFFTKPWTDLSGENNWKDLLDPLDEDLRKYIIHYGERVEVMEDAMNVEKVSKNYCLSLCTAKDMFSYVGLEKNNPYKYEVKELIIAKDDLAYIFPQLGPPRAWIGYIAVATDEMVKKEALGRRDILIVWRGTMTPIEGLLDLEDDLTHDFFILHGAGLSAKTHHGFTRLYNSVKSMVHEEVKKLVDQYKDEEISITIAGHSMGGALATLNAVDLVNHDFNLLSKNPEKRCMVSVFTFASPKLGNKEFEDFFNKLKSEKNLRALRMVNAVDMVPQWPPLRFYHVGEQLMLDSRQSKTLKSVTDAQIGGYIAIAHQLEVYLHLVAGTQGIDEGFNLDDRRHIALLNKHGDYIDTATAKKNHIPASWWVAEKKNMFQKDDGTWELDDAPKVHPQMN